MGYPELLAKTHELAAAAQTMGVLGAELRLRQMVQDGHPRVRGALQAVLRNLEPGLLDGLEPGQIAAIVGHLTYALQEALDLFGPTVSSDPSASFTTIVTWTAVP